MAWRDLSFVAGPEIDFASRPFGHRAGCPCEICLAPISAGWPYIARQPVCGDVFAALFPQFIDPAAVILPQLIVLAAPIFSSTE
jgi:hypothetical protein